MAHQPGERTEKPTPRRHKEARERGQVARSRDLGHAVSLGTAAVALGWLGGQLVERLAGSTAQMLARVGAAPMRTLTPEELGATARGEVWVLFALVAPIAVAAMATGVLVQTAQGGWVFASRAVTLDWSRLSPSQGLRRLHPSHSGLDTVKAGLAIAVLGFLSMQLVDAMVGDGVRLARLTPREAGAEAWRDVRLLLVQSAIAIGFIAIGDYALQRYRVSSQLKMTKQEVKDDLRLAEGNPENRVRVRRVQREMMRRRMLTATARATLVITNPTHYAIALEYRRAVMAAPRVVAKGKGLLAAKVKEIAREHNVPIVENAPLARSLYAEVDVGDVIPSALFEAVAETIAYLIRLKQLIL